LATSLKNGGCNLRGPSRVQKKKHMKHDASAEKCKVDRMNAKKKKECVGDEKGPQIEQKTRGGENAGLNLAKVT